MPKEKHSKGEATRVAIEDAALDLFLQHGYHATSMRQIAEHAGIALGGIYNHFSSKEEIFKGIIVDKHPYKKVLPLILEAKGDTPEDFLKNAIQITITEFEKEPYYIKLMLIEVVEFDGRHGSTIFKEIAPKVLPVFEQIIKSRKNLRVTNPAMLLRIFFGMVLSYFITEAVVSNSIIRKLMPKNARDIYVDVILHGVLKTEN